MPLQLAIISEHKTFLGDDCAREFREDGGSIGRSLGNDWILPDPDCLISGKHAFVQFHAGNYFLADISTNGVYVNGELSPIGKGSKRQLFNGDKLRMGEIEFQVSLNEAGSPDATRIEETTIVPDHVDQLVADDLAGLNSGVINEEDVQSGFFGNDVMKRTTEEINGKQGDQPNPFGPGPSEAELTRVELEKLLDAFMRGLDLSRADLPASTDRLQIMENAGRALKGFVTNTSDLAARHAAQKAMYRLDENKGAARDDESHQPAGNSRESILQLLLGQDGQEHDSMTAVRKIYEDLKLHNDAVLEGMMSAFAEYIGHFAPDRLQENFDRTIAKKPLFQALNQFKYWQLYRDLYPLLTQQGAGTYPQQFGEDFATAYANCMAERKRTGGADEHRKTQVVEEQVPVSYDKDNLVDQTEEQGYNDQF